MEEITKQERLEYTKEAQAIVNSLTLEEKVSLMSGSMTFEEVRGAVQKKTKAHYNQFPYPAGGIPQKGIPPMLFVDGPRGVVCGNDVSTAFPVSMLRGATFDKSLEEEIGQAMGEEVLAFGGNLSGAVCINLPYNPGWGRSQETYGEDSFAIGEMASALVRGIQSQGVIACLKHFAFNQMENVRFTVNIDADKRTEREVFLKHFKKCIDAGAGAVMTAYNKYQDKMCSQNDYLIKTILKGEWDFDGFTISDFVWGVKDTVEAANSGLDVEMPNTKFYGKDLIQAVKNGKVSESVVDDAALRIIRTLMTFQKHQKKVKYDVVGCEAHVKLALEAAREGITLIKNKDDILPLNRDRLKKILVLGRLGRENNLGDRGSSQVYPKHVVTPFEGLSKLAPKTEVVFYDGSNITHSKELAAQSDAVIFVVGYDYNDEGEFVAQNKKDNYLGAIGGDRRYLSLSMNDQDLINKVGPVNKNSVAVLIGGNMIMLDEWKNNVNAIVMAYYPGMQGGTALAEILYGDVNPSGKIPFVIPQKVEHLPQVNWSANAQHYDYYHGYQKLDKEGHEPEEPYGFGLSYTSFRIAEAKSWVKDNQLFVCCNVKNVGQRDGTEVVQMYVGFPESRIDRPVKALTGFKRVRLQSGERRVITIACPLNELDWFNQETNQFEFEHTKYEIYIGNSSANKDLIKTTIEL